MPLTLSTLPTAVEYNSCLQGPERRAMLLRPSVEARLIPGDGRAYENALGGRRMTLSTQEQMLIEQRVANEAKSTGLAYVLWFFLGGLGMHRFYLGRPM